MKNKFRVEHDERNNLYKIYVNDFVNLIDNDNYIDYMHNNEYCHYTYIEKDLNLFKEILKRACSYVEYDAKNEVLYLNSTSFDYSFDSFNLFYALNESLHSFEECLSLIVGLYSTFVEDADNISFKDSLKIIEKQRILANMMNDILIDNVKEIINSKSYKEVFDIDEAIYNIVMYED